MLTRIVYISDSFRALGLPFVQLLLAVAMSQLNHLAVACVTLHVQPDFLQHATCQCNIWKTCCCIAGTIAVKVA